MMLDLMAESTHQPVQGLPADDGAGAYIDAGTQLVPDEIRPSTRLAVEREVGDVGAMRKLKHRCEE